MTLSALLRETYPFQTNIPIQIPDQALMESLFYDNQPRLAHLRTCHEFAKKLSSGLKLRQKEKDLLISAALWHDIGRANELVRTGYHALDGAIYLAHSGAHDWVVEAVLRHSGADNPAYLPAPLLPIYKQCSKTKEAKWLCLAVSWCDWRSANTGTPVSLGQRFLNIVSSNPNEKDRVKRNRYSFCEIRGIACTFLNHIGQKWHTPLPWLFIDIDNTLIEPGTNLSAANKQALCSYALAGGRFSLSTGKHSLSMKKLLQELPQMPGHIAVNGCLLFRKQRWEKLAGIEEKKAKALSRELIDKKQAHVVYTVEGLTGLGPIKEEHKEKYRAVSEILFAEHSTPIWENCLKILCFIDEDDTREKILRRISDQFGLDCCRSGPHFLELLPSGHGKAQGMEQLATEENFPLLHSVAIGDNENDLSMFRLAGLAAAVKNARPNIQDQADILLPPCREDGVAKFINILLNGQGWKGIQKHFSNNTPAFDLTHVLQT